jgi:hypothetical protein
MSPDFQLPPKYFQPGRHWPWRALLAAAFLGLATAAGQAASAPVLRLEIGPEVDSFHYREPGLMKEDGLLYGGFASLTAIFQSNLVWKVGGSLAGGILRYDGQTMDGEPVQVNTPDWLLDLRTSLGYKWNMFMPFAGFGLRYWSDNLGANSPSGYKRETTYLYSPVGLEISRTFAADWTLGASAEFDIFWAGFNRNTDFPGAGNTTLNFRQHSGYGAKASVFLEYSMTRVLGLRVEPFLQYWDIGKSEERGLVTSDGTFTVFEPANTTTLYGLRAALGW